MALQCGLRLYLCTITVVVVIVCVTIIHNAGYFPAYSALVPMDTSAPAPASDSEPDAASHAPAPASLRATTPDPGPLQLVPRPPPNPPPSPQKRKDSMKRVALWDAEVKAVRSKANSFENCPVSNCRFIDRRQQESFDDADVIIYNTRDNFLLNRPHLFPNRTRPDQLYVFYNIEAPIRSAFRLENAIFRDVFNLTMTYRLDSDIPVPHFSIYDTPMADPDADPLDLSSRSKMAIWIISHCTKSGSKRWAYGMELAKHINLDIYGQCGNLTCGTNENCLRLAETEYKFYLSFENSVCKDYVTEKLRKPLGLNIVPLVLGGLDYEGVLPPKSFINIRDYNSPKELADHLHYLDEHDDEYRSYLEWKKRLTVGDRLHGYCRLCQIVNDPNYSYQKHFDPYAWWVTGSHCVSEERQSRELGV